MALEEYEKARKLGLKEYRGDSVKGRYPYVIYRYCSRAGYRIIVYSD